MISGRVYIRIPDNQKPSSSMPAFAQADPIHRESPQTPSINRNAASGGRGFTLIGTADATGPRIQPAPQGD